MRVNLALPQEKEPKTCPALPHIKGAIALRLRIEVIRTPDKLTMYYIYIKYICQEIHFKRTYTICTVDKTSGSFFINSPKKDL